MIFDEDMTTAPADEGAAEGGEDTKGGDEAPAEGGDKAAE